MIVFSKGDILSGLPTTVQQDRPLAAQRRQEMRWDQSWDAKEKGPSHMTLPPVRWGLAECLQLMGKSLKCHGSCQCTDAELHPSD